MADPRTETGGTRAGPQHAASHGLTGAVRRIAIVAPSAERLWRLRAGLIGALIKARHGVACFAPEFDADCDRALTALGAVCRPFPTRFGGLPMFAERNRIVALSADLADWRPSAVLISAGPTMLQAAKAARRAKVERVVALVNALPVEPNASTEFKALGRTLELADIAVFHNGDDPKTLKRARLLPADLSYVVVPGAGVDLTHFAPQPLPSLAGGLTFLMIARLDTTKGVIDFCKAAAILKSRAPQARFQLAGPPGSGITGIGLEQLQPFADCIDYLGPLTDVRPALGGCHIYVYPSHGEGLPASVIEAMAVGRPVITTRVAGCRDTVDERINGCLVPPSDPAALASAMESFLKRPDLIASTARASRSKAERRFDQREVNASLMGVLGLV